MEVLLPIILGGLSGLAVNYFTAMYNEYRVEKRNLDIFYEEVKRFIKVSQKYLDVQYSSNKEQDIDFMLKIKNLKSAYVNDLTFYKSMNDIINTKFGEFNKVDRDLAFDIIDKVHSIQILLFQIELNEPYSRNYENLLARNYNLIKDYLTEINEYLNDTNKW